MDKTVRIGWMYPDCLNLHGERGSVQAFERVGENLSVDVSVRRIEDFDDPIIYMEVCKYFAGNHNIHLIANLEYSKYESFCRMNKSHWEYALDYLASNGFVQNIPVPGIDVLVRF